MFGRKRSKLHFWPKKLKIANFYQICFRMHLDFNARNWKNTKELKFIEKRDFTEISKIAFFRFFF